MVNALISSFFKTIVLDFIALLLCITLIILKSMTHLFITKYFMNLAYLGISLKVSNNGMFTDRLLNFKRNFFNFKSSFFFLSVCGNGGGIFIWNFNKIGFPLILKFYLQLILVVLHLQPLSTLLLAFLNLAHLKYWHIHMI